MINSYGKRFKPFNNGGYNIFETALNRFSYNLLQITILEYDD